MYRVGVSMFNVNILICTAYCEYCVFSGKRAKISFTIFTKNVWFEKAQVIKVQYNIIRVTHFHSSMTSILNSED